MRPSLRRFIVAVTATSAALFGSTVVGAPAHANASGCSSEYGFTVPYIGVFIPTTGVCVDILGSGLSATSFRGQFLVQACNFKIVLERWDANNVLRLTNSSPTYNGCHTDPRNHIMTVSNVGLYDGGKACAALYMAGAFVDRACVFTYR